MTIRFNSPSLQRLLRRPTWVGGFVAVAFIGWVAWLGYAYLVAPTPTEDDIAGQILQLDATGLNTLNTHLTDLRQPSPPAASIPPALFTPQR